MHIIEFNREKYVIQNNDKYDEYLETIGKLDDIVHFLEPSYNNLIRELDILRNNTTEVFIRQYGRKDKKRLYVDI